MGSAGTDQSTEGHRVLVTGATGYIGANLIGSLLDRGFAVRALVREDGRLRHHKRMEAFRGDLVVPRSLNGIADGVHSVIHCAGVLGKWRTGGKELNSVNVEGSLNLLTQFAGKQLHRFVHLSAGGVTGPVKATPADETYSCRPGTAYEKAKYTAERKILEAGGQMGIPVLTVRPTFTFGPGDPHKLALFRAIKKRRFAFVGNGKSVNTPVYIDDLVDGILLAMEKGVGGEVYIIGGEMPVTKAAFVYTVADALGVTRPTIRIPRWVAWGSSLGLECLGRIFGFEPILTRSRVQMMAGNYGYSIEKARRELDYRPKVGLAEGIHRTVRYYNEEGLI